MKEYFNSISSEFEKALKKAKITLFMSVSAATQHSIDALVKKLLKIVLDERKKRDEAEQEMEEEAKKKNAVPVLRPHLDSGGRGCNREDYDAASPLEAEWRCY